MHYKMQGEIGDGLALESIECLMTSNVGKKKTVLSLSLSNVLSIKKQH